jgi:hypothetical protein
VLRRQQLKRKRRQQTARRGQLPGNNGTIDDESQLAQCVVVEAGEEPSYQQVRDLHRIGRPPLSSPPIFAKTRGQIDQPLGCCAMFKAITVARQA